MAPPASAARATAAAPCPYPFALTTAQSWAGRTSWDSTWALWVIAARSISAQAGRDVPCAMVGPPSASALKSAGITVGPFMPARNSLKMFVSHGRPWPR